VITAVCAAIWPVLRAGVDDLRVLRVDGNSPHLCFFRQAVGQGLPVIASYSPAE
jgi:hypothetical protein